MKQLAALVCLGLAFAASAQPRSDAGLTFDETLTLIEKTFIRDITREELVERALHLLLQDLDPYSRFLNGEERKLMDGDMAAEFVGIGVSMDFTNDKHVPRIERRRFDCLEISAAAARTSRPLSPASFSRRTPRACSRCRRTRRRSRRPVPR